MVALNLKNIICLLILGVPFHETTTVSRICWRYFTLHLYYCLDSFLMQEYL